MEAVIGEDKSAITDAGPSRGPILRSSSPHQVTQEMWAWITATQLVRIHGCHAIQAGRPPSSPPLPAASRRRGPRPPGVVHDRPPRGRPLDDPDPGVRECPRLSARCRRRASQLPILAALLPVRPPRHRERRTKGRQQFPSSPATGRVPASTGKAAITI